MSITLTHLLKQGLKRYKVKFLKAALIRQRIASILIIITEYRIKNPKPFILFQSLIIGVIAGLTAVFLKNIVSYTGSELYKNSSPTHPQFLYLALPGVGILLTILYLKYFVKDNISHGISKVLQAISKNHSRIKFHNTYSSVISSILTVGFGGSVGLEAPIVYTGSAVGSNLARVFRQDYKTTTLLLACGAAGAIAGIFKAPIAATIFALEVLMIDLSMWSIIPLLMASVSGALVSYFLMGDNVMFNFILFDSFEKKNIAYYLILGITCGFISVAFMRQLSFFEKKMALIEHFWQKITIGAILLGILIFLMPPLFGEGYLTLQFLQGNNPEQITQLIQFDFLKTNINTILIFLAVVILFKGLAVAATTGSGGIGGVFAPALFMGGVTGYIVAELINKLSFVNVSVRNFSLAGMAGVMAGIMHAPLTAIFLVAEITGGFSLIIPLIVTASSCYLTVKYFEKDSIYTKELADKGEALTHHKDRNILTLLKIEKVIENDGISLKTTDNLRTIVELFKKYDRNLFPVLGNDKELLGMVMLNDIRNIMFNQELLDTTFVIDYYIQSPAVIDFNDSFERIMKVFDDTQAWNLPVLKDGMFAGIISKSKLYSEYRKLMVQLSDE
jgi:CIC family chloride channel protein